MGINRTVFTEVRCDMCGKLIGLWKGTKGNGVSRTAASIYAKERGATVGKQVICRECRINRCMEAEREKPMKRTILKALKRVWKFVIEIFTPIIACGIAICLTILFIVQLFWGAVDAELAVLIVAYAVLFTAGICRELHTPSKEEVAKGIWVQLTTETMLFVAKGQMTQREAAHIMRAMRYVARKNGWEEAEEETGKA